MKKALICKAAIDEKRKPWAVWFGYGPPDATFDTWGEAMGFVIVSQLESMNASRVA